MPSKKVFKRALITGSSSGLGKGLADFLEKQGIEVIRMGSKDFDLTNSTERKKLLDLISEKSPDLVVNNAGFGLYGPSLDLTTCEQLKMIEINCAALVEISLHAAATLRKNQKKGTILNISSAAAFIPFPTFNVYAASKAFVNHFSLALDGELCKEGIRVLCACPGQIAANFRSRAAKGHPQTPDNRTMSIDVAVTHLWKQIEQDKTLYVFDWRMRIMIWISRLTPRVILNKFLKKRLRERYA